MAPSKTSAGRAKPRGQKSGGSPASSPPAPFRRAPETLEPFYAGLSRKHVYVAHVDAMPRGFKRKIFAVPVALNLAVLALLLWRAAYILPYYWLLLQSSLLGLANETTVVAAESSRTQLAGVIARRALTFMLDLALAVFVWPWPFEFCLGRAAGNPVAWRWAVGFRDAEIYVRRSRSWDRLLPLGGGGDGDLFDEAGAEGRAALLSLVRKATSPMLLQQKTGYLTMDGEWDLDWAAMVRATRLVDDGTLALDAFRVVVLLHHREHGWLCVDTRATGGAEEDERRRKVFSFRDALAAVGKEDLFFRWIEIVQFESSQPDGFGPEKQADVAKQIRDLFLENGINFDEFWKESVGSEPSTGI